MRVLAVSTWLPTSSSPSTGSFVVRDARAIADLGHDVALVHLVPPDQLGDDPEREVLAGLPVTRVPMSTTDPVQILRAGMTLRRLARGADLVHTMAFSTLLPMAWWRPEAPWVHTEHWSGLTAPQTLPSAWRRALPVLRPLLARPDVATAVCDYLARPVREVRGERPTVVVPCIVPPLREVPERAAPVAGAPDTSVADAPDGTGHGTLRMVSVGGLIERKDPLLAVDTVAELRRRGLPAQLRFVGEGPLRGAITQRAREQRVEDAVELVGTRDRAGVLEELAAADLFLGPTRGDNFFVSCAEAVVAGRPVVVGSTGGQGEYLQPDIGVTVDQQSAPAYADAVQQVLRTAEGWSAEQIAATIGDDFSEESVARGYQGAYDQAAAVRGRRGSGR